MSSVFNILYVNTVYCTCHAFTLCLSCQLDELSLAWIPTPDVDISDQDTDAHGEWCVDTLRIEYLLTSEENMD